MQARAVAKNERFREQTDVEKKGALETSVESAQRFKTNVKKKRTNARSEDFKT